jgi:type I restriction enzyme, S subunit
MSFDAALPDGWHWATLDDVRAQGKSVVSGPFGSNIGSRFFVASGVPVIRGSNLTTGMDRFREDEFVFLTPEKAAEFTSCEAISDDLIFTAAGTIGQVGLIPKTCKYPKYIISNKQLRARLDVAKIDPEFAYYWFASPTMVQTIQSRNTGSTIPLINLTVLKSLPIPVPPLNEQREIAGYLATLDDRITLLRETNATLEGIAQALFKSWFVDFDPVRAKMAGRTPEGMDEATAALFPDALEETELGLVPKGWTIRTMADVSTVGIGKTPPRKEQHWFSESPSDVRWVSIRDMGAAGVYAAETSEFLTTDAVEKFNVRRVPDNTVLMSFKMTIGRVAITDGEMTTNEAIAHFKLEPGAPITSEFIYLHLKQFDFSKLSSTSSIADAVNSKTVREIPILVPSIEVLRAFQDQVGVLFSALKNSEQHAQSIAQLRDALLPRLISGQLRLPEAQAQLEHALA